VSDEFGTFSLKTVTHQQDDKYPLSGPYASTTIAALTLVRGPRFEYDESRT
jgi:hypothetical protein